MQLGGGVLTPQHLRFLLAGGGLTPQREREVLGGVVSHVLARCPPPRCGVSAALGASVQLANEIFVEILQKW